MWILYILLISSFAQGLERRLSYSTNPGCDEYNMAVSYVAAEGSNDTIHYLWDFTSRPTLYLAVTDVNVTLDINCAYFVANMAESFNFSKTPIYQFSLILDKLIEFNDVNDTGILTPSTPQVSYQLDGFEWVAIENLRGSPDGRVVSMTMTGTNFRGSLNGNFNIQLSAFGLESHDVDLPRLLHSPNSTQCKVTLENLITDSGFNNSRFALEMIMMVDVLTPKAQQQRFGGAFLQWRPIIYVAKIASIGNSSELVTYNLTNVTDPDSSLADTLPYKFYGTNASEHLIEQAIVSLGTSQDGFYRKTNYSSWTFLVSFGSPEEERFSLLVILVMCIGLGLPALLMIVGGTYLCVNRIRKKKDELSLERLRYCLPQSPKKNVGLKLKQRVVGNLLMAVDRYDVTISYALVRRRKPGKS